MDVGYNAFWLDRGDKMTGTFRTSLVVDPPDGRIPALTETAKRRSAERYTRWGPCQQTWKTGIRSSDASWA